MSRQKPRICICVFDGSPSATVRGAAHVGHLRESGLDVHFLRCFNPAIAKLTRIGWLGRNFPPVWWLNRLAAQARLFLFLANSRKFDRIFLVKYVPRGFIGRLRARSKARLIYDFDDAVWVKSFLGEDHFREIVSQVDSVTCDNEFLASMARVHCRDVRVIPGPPQVEKFAEHRDASPAAPRPTGEVIVGWIGSPSTLFYLRGIFDALEETGRRHPNVTLRLVGVGTDMSRVPRFQNIRVSTLQGYDEAGMIREVSTFDVGLFPVLDDDISLGRGCLKATIYMAAGVPVVCSDNVNTRALIRNGENGFLAEGHAGWVEALDQVVSSAEKRARLGASGRSTVAGPYSAKAISDRLASLFLESP